MDERVILLHDGIERSFLLHLPNGNRRIPIVMMLHGAGGSAELAADETGWSRLADFEGFGVVYPEGVAIRPDKTPKFLTNPQEWNDGSGRGRQDDVGFLDAVLDRISERINPIHVFVTGFSNGAGMTFRFAAERAEHVTAIAPVAGHCWVEPKRSRPVPTFYIVGDADPLVPIDGGEVRTFWGRREQRPAVAQTLAKWAKAMEYSPGSTQFPVKVIAHHGHHWPGGKAILGERLGGPASKEVDATNEIWDFFRG